LEEFLKFALTASLVIP